MMDSAAHGDGGWKKRSALMTSIKQAKARTEKAKEDIIARHEVKEKTFTIRLADQVGRAVKAQEDAAAEYARKEAAAEVLADIEKKFERSMRDKSETSMGDNDWLGGTSILGDSEDMDQDRATNFLGLLGLPANSKEAQRFCKMMEKIGRQDAANRFAEERRLKLEKYRKMLAEAKEKGNYAELEQLALAIAKMTGEPIDKVIDGMDIDKKKLTTLFPKPKPAKDIATALGMPYDIKDYRFTSVHSARHRLPTVLRRHSQQLKIMSAASGRKRGRAGAVMASSMMGSMIQSNLEAATSQGATEEEAKEKKVGRAYAKRKALLQNVTGLGEGHAAEELEWGDASRGIVRILPIKSTISLAMKLKARAKAAKKRVEGRGQAGQEQAGPPSLMSLVRSPPKSAQTARTVETAMTRSSTSNQNQRDGQGQGQGAQEGVSERGSRESGEKFSLTTPVRSRTVPSSSHGHGKDSFPTIRPAMATGAPFFRTSAGATGVSRGKASDGLLASTRFAAASPGYGGSDQLWNQDLEMESAHSPSPFGHNTYTSSHTYTSSLPGTRMDSMDSSSCAALTVKLPPHHVTPRSLGHSYYDSVDAVVHMVAPMAKQMRQLHSIALPTPHTIRPLQPPRPSSRLIASRQRTASRQRSLSKTPTPTPPLSGQTRPRPRLRPQDRAALLKVGL